MVLFQIFLTSSPFALTARRHGRILCVVVPATRQPDTPLHFFGVLRHPIAKIPSRGRGKRKRKEWGSEGGKEKIRSEDSRESQAYATVVNDSNEAQF